MCNICSFEERLDMIRNHRDAIINKKPKINSKIYTFFCVTKTFNGYRMSSYTNVDEKISLVYKTIYPFYSTKMLDITHYIDINELYKLYNECLCFIKQKVIDDEISLIKSEFD